MLTEQEERVIILIENALRVGAVYHECHFDEEVAIKDVLTTSEVVLHPEAVEQLVEWLKESEL